MISQNFLRSVLAASLALPSIPLTAQAQTDTLSDIPCPTNTITIAIMGDSLADGIWGAFFRAFSSCDTVEVLRLTSVSDGLARSDPAKWLGKLEGIKPDLTLVSIGANDITNIRSERARLIYGQSDWATEYQARATTLAAGLKSASNSVIWFGLPVVGRSDFEASYRLITKLQETAAVAENIDFIDTHSPTMFGKGVFVMSSEIDGTLRRIRHTDQVHFTTLGYDLIAGLTHDPVIDVFNTISIENSLNVFELQ